MCVVFVACGGPSSTPSDGGGGGGDGANPTGDAAPPAAFCQPTPAPTGTTFYVAPNGSDSANGAEATPWATIEHAVDTVPDGSLVLVKPGTYTGRIRMDRRFAQGIVVRSEMPYLARLRNAGTVITIYTGEGIAIEGFDIAHSGPGGALVVQIQDLITGPDAVSRIALRNNVMHDSYDNDILKINNGARDVIVEGNVFYNQSGSDEHMDVNSVENVEIRGNVFFNDFAGSGRVNGNDTSGYIVIKDSNGNTDGIVGSKQIVVERNVFLHWEGSTGSNFVLVGEDGTATFEAEAVRIENNLMLGDSANTMRAAFGIKGSRDVTFRNNTIVGNLPSLAFAMRLNREGANQQVTNARFYNNVWADPTGTMEDFSDTLPADIASFTLANNAYWNGAGAIPNDAAEHVNPNDDGAAVTGDPRLPAITGVVVPRWNENTGKFADGSSTVCAAFEQLVMRYATPASGSSLIDAADAANAPAFDILGRARTTADIGAVELE